MDQESPWQGNLDIRGDNFQRGPLPLLVDLFPAAFHPSKLKMESP